MLSASKLLFIRTNIQTKLFLDSVHRTKSAIQFGILNIHKIRAQFLDSSLQIFHLELNVILFNVNLIDTLSDTE